MDKWKALTNPVYEISDKGMIWCNRVFKYIRYHNYVFGNKIYYITKLYTKDRQKPVQSWVHKLVMEEYGEEPVQVDIVIDITKAKSISWNTPTLHRTYPVQPKCVSNTGLKGIKS